MVNEHLFVDRALSPSSRSSPGWTMPNTHLSRVVAGLIALVLAGPAIVLSGPAIGAPALSGAAVRSTLTAQANGSTFTEASVTRSASAAYVIRWRSGAKRVGCVGDHGSLRGGEYSGRAGRQWHRAVGAGRANGVVTVEGLADAARWYFKLGADTGETVVLAERRLELPHAANARDLGGTGLLMGSGCGPAFCSVPTGCQRSTTMRSPIWSSSASPTS